MTRNSSSGTVSAAGRVPRLHGLPGRARACAGPLLLALVLCATGQPCDGAGLFDRIHQDRVLPGGSPGSGDRLAGLVWCDLLETFELPQDGTVIDVGPSGPDVGHGLAMVGFAGTLFVVGPDPVSLEQALTRYRAFLPGARVVGVAGSPLDVVSKLPVRADALVSGSVLDGLSARGPARSGAELDRETASGWKRLLETVDPRVVVIGQPSGRQDGLASVAGRVRRVLDLLRPAGPVPRLVEQRLVARGQSPSCWLAIRRRPLDAAGLSRQVPGAVQRLGRPTFVAMDAYPAIPGTATVLYVRNDLLEIMCGRPFDGDRARAFVEQNLLLTLDPKSRVPGSSPFRIWVDRQEDPMRMSLTGNLGSGRAAYVGDRYNIKGVGKTVLATSRDPTHGNGLLDLVSGLWEMICANVLQTNLRTGASPVVAMVDHRRLVRVPWVKFDVPSGSMIRVDTRGELDRPTHLFKRNKPVTADQIRHMARRFGMQDGDKFIERILHGAWSAGNISLDGHLVDYDTVFALRGRAPQWSYRPNWISDFFGLEGLGQKTLLEALVKHPLNVDHVTVDEVRRVFDDARRAQIDARFLDLVGVSPADAGALFPRQSAAVSRLARQFETLSMKMYPNFKATAAWDEEARALSVYDLSRFFRFYPILRRAGRVDHDTALRLIRNRFGLLKASTESRMTPDVRAALTADHVVSSEEQLVATDRQASRFVEEYDRLLSAIDKALPGSWGPDAARAYVINEDRTYLNARPGNEMLLTLVKKYRARELPPRQLSELLQLLIDASDRIPRYDSLGRCQADLRLFLDAYTSNLVHADGQFQPRLSFLRTPVVSEAASENLQTIARGAAAQPAEGFAVEVGGTAYPCTIERQDGRFHVVGPRLPLALLVDDPPIRFLRAGQVVRPRPILADEPR